jgi:hypothetical protein
MWGLGKGIFKRQALPTRDNLNFDIQIISYCWCVELIRSVFSSDILCLSDDNGTTTIKLI